MSLYIVGSVSRITSNIVHQMAKNQQYTRITIADILPTYECHQRFYRLQRELQNLQYNKLTLKLDKISVIDDLQKQNQFDDVLSVTHDYYHTVISKTKLMELVAEACKKRQHLFYATPVEYDHFGYANPIENYSKAEDNVLKINPRATFIRSDVQERTEALSYFNQEKKNSLEKQVFSTRFNFLPRVVDPLNYAKVVAETIAAKKQGKKILVQGAEAKDAYYADYLKDIDPIEYQNIKENVVHLAQKYNSVQFSGYETV